MGNDFGAELGGEKFEAAKKAEKLAQAHVELTEPCQMYKTDDGKAFMVSKANILSSQVRNMVTSVLRVVDPEGYAAYKAMKYAKGPNPTLAERKAAYLFAFQKFLDKTYEIAGC